MDYLLAPFFLVLALLISIVGWVLKQHIWIGLWLLLPLVVVALI